MVGELFYTIPILMFFWLINAFNKIRLDSLSISVIVGD